MRDRLLAEILNGLNPMPEVWSVRENKRWAYYRKDNNIFSLASVLFILRELKSELSDENQRLINRIISDVSTYFSKYRNKDGRQTYNFYQTQPSRHFPNGLLMQHSDHFRLPDDIDDTALITCVLQPELEEVIRLKKLTAEFAEKKPNDTTIYNTWYGKNMPKEQDVCAILNLLYLFQVYQLPYEKTDFDTFDFLIKQFSEISKNPFSVARHYAHPALIYYHYSRFISRFSSPLDVLKDKLAEDIQIHLMNETVWMNRLILSTSLLKLGRNPSELDLSEPSFKGFYSFIGAPLAPYSNLISKKLASNPWTWIFWKSEILNKTLLLEYLVWNEKKQ